MTYTDKQHGESDELEIQLEDSEGLWRGDWYPGKGDKVQVQLGYDGEQLVDCGTFQVDEIELSGPPDTVSIKALSTGIKSAMRTKNSSAYDGQTIKQIAQKIADKHGMEVVDNTDGVVTSFKYTTQNYINTLLSISKQFMDGMTKYGTGNVTESQYADIQRTLPAVMNRLQALEDTLRNERKYSIAYEITVLRNNLSAALVSDTNYSGPLTRLTWFTTWTGSVEYVNEQFRLAGKKVVTGTSTKLAMTKVTRVTQHRETDLEFLKRISEEYGFVFSIKDQKLVFVSIFDLEKGEAVKTFDRGELIQYSFRDKTSQSYKAAKVQYHNPVDKKLVTYTTKTLTNADGVTYKEITKDDTLVVRTKSENQEQAEAKAKAAVYRTNSKLQEGRITVEGDPTVLAGNNIVLTGMGIISGKFQVTESSHRFERGGGYTTEATLKRVGYIDKNLQK